MDDNKGLGASPSGETWRTLPDLGRYHVSDLGRVFSSRTKSILTGTPVKGYLNVRIGSRKLHAIHRLVCAAFHGPCPPDKEMVGHLDGNKLNNRADNLAWITRAENTLHSIEHGTFRGNPPLNAPDHFRRSGEAHPHAKLTSEQVAEIRASSLGHKPIARIYGVSDGQIRRIRKGVAWKE